MLGFFYKYFGFERNKADLKHEVMAGFAGYLSMAYIMFTIPMTIIYAFPGATDLNGALNTYAVLSNGYTVGQMVTSLTIAVCLASGIGTLFLAFYARLPFALAPSLSLTLYFTYSLCLDAGYTYGLVLAAVFISGAIFSVVTLLGWREAIMYAIPDCLKFAAASGIGIFLAITGLQKIHLIVPGKYTLLKLDNIFAMDYRTIMNVLLTILAIILASILMHKKVAGGILISKLLCILLALPLNLVDAGNAHAYNVAYTIKPVLFTMDFGGLFSGIQSFSSALSTICVIIIGISLVDMFDSIGTLLGAGYKIGLLDKNLRAHKLKKALIADSVSTSIGACLGSPNVSIRAESAVAIVEKGKTGFTALIIGVLFLLSSFAAPFIRLIPNAATASTLLIIGALMLDNIKYINFEDYTELIPAFLTIIMIPFTFSITTGLAFGVISYTAIRLFSGRYKEVSPILYIMSVLFLFSFMIVSW